MVYCGGDLPYYRRCSWVECGACDVSLCYVFFFALLWWCVYIRHDSQTIVGNVSKLSSWFSWRSPVVRVSLHVCLRGPWAFTEFRWEVWRPLTGLVRVSNSYAVLDLVLMFTLSPLPIPIPVKFYSSLGSFPFRLGRVLFPKFMVCVACGSSYGLFVQDRMN